MPTPPASRRWPSARAAAPRRSCARATSSPAAPPCRADLPHHQLRHGVRHTSDCRGLDLQPRGLAGLGAGSPRPGGDASAPGAMLMAGLLVQALAAGSFMFAQRLGEFYAVRRCSASPTGCHAALCVSRAITSASQIMGTCSRGGDGIEPRHGIGPWARRLALRQVRQLCTDVHLLIRHRPSPPWRSRSPSRRRLSAPPSFSLRKMFGMNPAPGFKKRPDHRIVTKPAASGAGQAQRS